MSQAKVCSINKNAEKGTSKAPVQEAILVEAFGLEGDAHGGPGPRQVSLLAVEDIQTQNRILKEQKKNLRLAPGDFAENITVEGLDLSTLKIGDKIGLGAQAVLEVSAIGKTCHGGCRIYEALGDCIMPRQGVFARVLTGGKIRVGDRFFVLAQV